MAVSIPPQRHRCPTHEWCTEAAHGHRMHVGELHALTTARGIEIRVSLSAEDGADPVVRVEATFGEFGPARGVRPRSTPRRRWSSQGSSSASLGSPRSRGPVPPTSDL